MITTDQKKETGSIGEENNAINLPENCAKADSSGTSPNRYESVSKPSAGESDSDNGSDGRLLSPDKGEN